MEQIISNPRRLFSYILQLGESFHIIADGQPFMEVENCSSALLSMFCFLYVFDVGYSPEVMPAFLFIQSCILEVSDGKSSKCQNLQIFLKQFKKFGGIS